MKYLKLFEDNTNFNIDDIFQELVDDFSELSFKKIPIKRYNQIAVYRSDFKISDREVLKEYMKKMSEYIDEINDRLESLNLKCHVSIGGHPIMKEFYINIKIIKIK